MDKVTFIKNYELIADHPVFQNNSQIPQKPAWFHFAAVMVRLGCDGNGASIGRSAFWAGASYGSICNYTTRVLTAINSLADKDIYWPDAAERVRISARFEKDHGLLNAVAFVDGTPVNFMQRPHWRWSMVESKMSIRHEFAASLRWSKDD